MRARDEQTTARSARVLTRPGLAFGQTTGTLEEKIYQRQLLKGDYSCGAVDEKADAHRYYTSDELAQVRAPLASPPHLPRIYAASLLRVSPAHLLRISAASRVHLPCTSRASPVHLARISRTGGREYISRPIDAAECSWVSTDRLPAELWSAML